MLQKIRKALQEVPPLRRNFAAGSICTAINILIAGAGYAFYLHKMGYEEYGIWLVLATLLSLTQLANLGFGPALVKLIAEEHGRRDPDGVKGYCTGAILILLTTGAVGFVILTTFRHDLPALFRVSSHLSRQVSLLVPGIGLMSIYGLMVQIFSAALTGLGRIDLVHYFGVIGNLATFLVSLTLLLFGWGVQGLFFGSLTGMALVNLLTVHHIRGRMAIRIFSLRSLDLSRIRRLLDYGSYMLGTMVIGIVLGPFNKLIISRAFGVGALPIYEISFNGSIYLRTFFESGLRALTPEVSRVVIERGRDAFQRIKDINRSARQVIWMAGAPIWLLIGLFAETLIRLWLGSNFKPELVPALQCFLAGTFCSLLGVPSYYILLGLGETRKILTSHVILAGTNIILVLLTLSFGGMKDMLPVIGAYSMGMLLSTTYLTWERRRSARILQTSG